MELDVPTAEDGASDDAVPLLADEGGAGEVRGVLRWEAEEALLDELVHQSRRIPRRRRRHGGRRLGFGLWLALAVGEWGMDALRLAIWALGEVGSNAAK